MNNQQIMRFLFIIVPVLLLLSIWWNAFVPFLSIAMVFLILLVIRNGWVKRVLGKPHEPTVYYQPTQPSPSQKQEPPPRANPPLGFDLTAQEYQQLSKQYQQGYQGQVPYQPTKSAMPKESSSWEQEHYEQPQAHYPEQMPPMA